jgi:hypothetical protein
MYFGWCRLILEQRRSMSLLNQKIFSLLWNRKLMKINFVVNCYIFLSFFFSNGRTWELSLIAGDLASLIVPVATTIDNQNCLFAWEVLAYCMIGVSMLI